MRRLTALLCLMLSLVGTPLRLAEAADDFARSLAELADAVRIEEVDGGVGDEAELATLKAAEPLAESSPPRSSLGANFTSPRPSTLSGPRQPLPVLHRAGCIGERRRPGGGMPGSRSSCSDGVR